MNDNQAMHAMLIDDAYQVERVLAHGACGLTDLVSIDGAGPFIRKKIPLELARRRVWSALSECSCSRLPHVEATYELPDCFVVVYDFIPGGSLQSVLDQDGVLAVDKAVEYAAQICEAAQALHEQCVIHRDITPGNIVLSSDGAHLIDLGIARIRVDDAVRDTASLGTWGFASPEQFGFAQSDARSDVYSIGRVLGSALVGLRPDEEGYDAALSDENRVPAALKCVIDKACAFEPSMRYQSAAEMGEALIRLLDTSLGSVGEAPANYGNVLQGATDRFAGPYSENVTNGSPTETVNYVASPVSSGQVGGVSREQFRRSFAVIVVGLIAVVLMTACGLTYKYFVGTSSSAAGESASVAQEGYSSNEGSASNQEGVSSGDGNEAGSLGDTDGNEPRASSLLKVEETGWTRMKNGYVNYVFALRNTNDSSSVLIPSVRVVARDKKGKSLATEDGGSFVIGPGQTIYQGGTMKTSQKPATLDAEVVDSSASEVVEGNLANSYSFKGVSSHKDDLGGIVFVGDVSTSGVEDYGSWGGDARVTVVLRDKRGKLMGCEETFVEGLKGGGSSPFETLSSKLDGFSSYEVYAEDWL